MKVYPPTSAPRADEPHRPHWLVVARRRCSLTRRVEQTLGGADCDATVATTRNEAVAALWDKRRPTSHAALVQTRPGELPPGLPAWLRECRPRMELVSVAGNWCEGELRTGKPWDNKAWEGVPRVYWCDLGSWLRRELVGSKTLDNRPPSRPPLVMLNAGDYETASALTHALAEEGVRVLWRRRLGAQELCHSVDAGLWVDGQLNGLRAEALREFTARMRSTGAPTLALLDFPRLDEAQLAERIGVARVFGKPWSSADLAQAILERCPAPIRSLKAAPRGAAIPSITETTLRVA